MNPLSAIGELIAGLAGKVFNVFKLGAAAIVTRVLSAFGLSVVSMNALLPNLKAFLLEYVNALPPQVLQLASDIGLDVFFTMILSALTVRFAYKVFIIPTSIAQQIQGGGPQP